jgi:hypothetical protein
MSTKPNRSAESGLRRSSRHWVTRRAEQQIFAFAIAVTRADLSAWDNPGYPLSDSSLAADIRAQRRYRRGECSTRISVTAWNA